MAKIKKFWFLLFLLQGCIIFNFVGPGTTAITTYDMPSNISKLIPALDKYVEENSSSIHRTLNGTGYDIGYGGRFYDLVSDSLSIQIVFYGDSITGFADNKNLSAIAITSIKKGNLQIVGRKGTKREKKLRANYLYLIEKTLILPLRERLKK